VQLHDGKCTISFVIVRVAVSLALLINLSLTGADMERAAKLARWPTTDAERVRFHDRYLFLTIDPRAPLTLETKVLQIEVVTEFRRLELIAEEHARLGDSFGRGGSRELVEALRPWRGRLAIDVHLQLPSCGNHCSPVIPPTKVVIDGVGMAAASAALRSGLHAHTGLSPAALGNMAEAMFDTDRIGQTTRVVRAIVDGKELARVSIDFSALD
jgi:hypothetical protein